MKTSSAFGLFGLMILVWGLPVLSGSPNPSEHKTNSLIAVIWAVLWLSSFATAGIAKLVEKAAEAKARRWYTWYEN